MNNDSDIKDLFDSLKKEDHAQLDVPDFETLVTPQKSYAFSWRVATVAAVFAFAIGTPLIYQFMSPTVVTNDFDLSLDYVPEEETSPLLTESASMFDWQADTDILINEFED